MPQYLFGDGDIAARRLGALFDVSAESTEAFLQAAVGSNPRLAVDLGCGPGYTTQFLSSLLHSDRTVGLDNSQNFLALARQIKSDRVEYFYHDVIATPFPVGPADLLFCRYLLTHLKDPQEAISKWATQLRPKGLLLMEETEWMHTDNRVFSTYIGIVESLLESQSNKLCIGTGSRSSRRFSHLEEEEESGQKTAGSK